MDKTRCIVTNRGKELLSRCQGGSKAMEFVKITAGSGVYSESEDLKECISLKDEKQRFNSFYISRYSTDTTIIRSTLSNEGLNENYKVREIGIWAREQGTEDVILYAVSVTFDDELADLMFVKQGNYFTTIEYNHYFKIANDVNVVISPEPDNSLSRMYAEFDRMKAKYEKRWEEDIGEIERTFERLKKTWNEDIKIWEREIKKLEELKSKVDRLNDAFFNDITKNPFLIRFDDLNGVIVKRGNFNKAKQRIEC